AQEGIPFREAHNIVGRMVKLCEDGNCDFSDLTDEQLQEIDSRVNRDALGDISIPACVNARKSFGGTAPSEVARQIETGRNWLEKIQKEQ
ncbi:MAG: argininosuccinate lyase, partial [Eubacterium sp.]